MGYAAISTNNAPSTSLVVAAAALGTIADNDLLVGLTTSDSATSTPGFGTGFTQVAGSPITLSSFDANRFAVAVKVAASEAGDYTFTSTGNACIGGIIRLTGLVASSTPHRVSSAKSDSANPSPQTITSAAFGSVTSAPCTVLFIAIVDGTGSDSTFAAPAGYTLVADICQTATFERQFMVACKDNVAAGFDGVLSGTATGNAGAWAVFAIALAAPATAAVTGTGTAGISETDVVAGGKIVDTTLTNETYLTNNAPPLPTYVGKGAFQSGTGALSVPWPAGHQAGDYAVLEVESANEAIATPADWTQVANSPQSTGTAAAAGGVRLAVFEKYATSGAEANASVADTGNHTTAIISAYRGVDQTTAVNASAGKVDAAATSSLSCPAVTTNKPNCLVINLIALDKDLADADTLSGAANANLANVTERHDQTVASGVGGGVALITGEKATAGNTGSTTATGDTATTHAYITLALQPQAVPTFDDGRQNFIDGFVSAQSEASGWNAKRSLIPVTAVTRISDTVARLTLPAIASYDITAQETITVTVPGSIVTGGAAIVATPTFTIDPSGGGGGGVTVLPGAGSASATGFAPSIGLPVTARPGVGAATATGFAPAIGLPQTVRPGAGQATATGFAPTIGLPQTVRPDVGAATLTGFAPTVSTVSGAANVAPGSGQASLTGFAPSIGLPVTVAPSSGQATLTGFAPTISTVATGGAVDVRPGTGDLVFEGFAPTVDIPAAAIGAGGSSRHGNSTSGFILRTAMRAAEAKRRGEEKPIAAIVAEPAPVVSVPAIVERPRNVERVAPAEIAHLPALERSAPVDLGESLLPEPVEPEPFPASAIEPIRARADALRERDAEIAERRSAVFALGRKEPVAQISPVVHARSLAEAKRQLDSEEELAWVLLLAA